MPNSNRKHSQSHDFWVLRHLLKPSITVSINVIESVLICYYFVFSPFGTYSWALIGDKIEVVLWIGSCMCIAEHWPLFRSFLPTTVTFLYDWIPCSSIIVETWFRSHLRLKMSNFSSRRAEINIFTIKNTYIEGSGLHIFISISGHVHH